MRGSLLVVAVAAIAMLPCCKKQPRDDTAGLPPATDWAAPQAGVEPTAGNGEDDPHAGVDMGGSGGAANGDDPHAGVDMGGGNGEHGEDPHAGLGIDMGEGDPGGGQDPAMAN